jgi:SET domain-containing protein
MAIPPAICAKNNGMAKRKFAIGQHVLVVRRSRTGRGLFTADPIEKRRCVVEYTGRVLSEAEMYASKSKYLFAINERKTIDGWEKTNIARYINHSCLPNCEIEISRGRIYVMSKRAIKPGEELFYDYDTEYFDAHIRPKGCMCSKCSPGQ